MIARVLVLAVLLAASRAHADDASARVPPAARAFAERGRAYHAAGDYPSAIFAFRSAYALAPSHGLLFNLAQAYRLAGNCDEAAASYRGFLADAAPTGDQRALAQRHLETTLRCGHRRLADEHRVDTPPELDAIAARHDPRPGLRDERIGIGLAIGGGVALAGAAYFAIDSSNAAPAVKGASGGDGQRSAEIARVLGTGGAVALAGGAMFYALGWRADKDAKLARAVAIVPIARGAEVSATWDF
jgi:tetratricopeptide (TPR) repeat protein